jgi:triphosphatase
VKAGEFQEPISELELELLEGHADDVLKLARKLVTLSGLRQGSLSKAARGYHLAQGNAPRVLKPTEILRVAPKSSVEQGFEASLELALSQWQYHEELWVRGVKGAKAEVLAAMALVRHSLTLFGGIVPRKASAHLRDLLTQVEALMASEVSAETAIYSPQTATAKLTLTEFLINRGWRTFLDAKAQAKIDDSFKRFADTHLSRHAAELKTIFGHPLGDQYGDQLIRLARNIDSILLLAGAYDGPVARAWLENWQGLLYAIKTRQHIEIEHFRNEAISQEPFWLHSGKR